MKKRCKLPEANISETIKKVKKGIKLRFKK
jgi:hypothetical protein